MDLQTNNTPIAPIIGTQEPQNLWPFFRRQGTCTIRIRGLMSGGSQSNGSPVNPAPQCANGNFPNKLMQTDYNDWAPRLGISYTPTAERGCPRGLRRLLQP